MIIILAYKTIWLLLIGRQIVCVFSVKSFMCASVESRSHLVSSPIAVSFIYFEIGSLTKPGITVSQLA